MGKRYTGTRKPKKKKKQSRSRFDVMRDEKRKKFVQ